MSRHIGHKYGRQRLLLSSCKPYRQAACLLMQARIPGDLSFSQIKLSTAVNEKDLNRIDYICIPDMCHYHVCLSFVKDDVMMVETLREGKTLRKHSLQGEKAASVLLKLFISDIERCHTTDVTLHTIITLHF